MITINNKQYRNLEEQVRFLTEQYNVNQGIAEWGIRILGVLESADELPSADTYKGEYGDAYAVGTEEPYNFYIWTRSGVAEGTGFWFDVGSIAIAGPVGPVGPQGPTGEKGERGSKWFSGTGKPTTTSGYLVGDYYINVSNNENRGNIWHLHTPEEGNWLLEGNILGPQGIPGATGPKGETGPQGPQGPQGKQGNPAQNVVILGTATTVDELPDPTTVPRNGAYLVGDPRVLYIIVGINNLMWTAAGTFNAATQVLVDGQFVEEFDADTKIDMVTGKSYDKNKDLWFPVAKKNSNGSWSFSWMSAVCRSQGGDEPTDYQWRNTARGTPVVRSSAGNISVPTPDEYTPSNSAVPKHYVDDKFQNKIATFNIDGYITLPAPVVCYGGRLTYPDYAENDGVEDLTEQYADVGDMYLCFYGARLPYYYGELNPHTFFSYLDSVYDNVANPSMQLVVEGESCCIQYLGVWYDSDSDTETFRITFNRGASIITFLYYFYNTEDGNNSAEELFNNQTTYEF